MKHIIKISVLFFTLNVTSYSYSAQPETDALAGCLVDSLNGKERKMLAKWIFLSMSSHPDIKPYANATEEDIDGSDRFVGELITRLLTENCPEQLKAAIKVNPQAIEKSFELVGQVAMQELMNNQETVQALTKYVQYTDQQKLKKLLSE